jgi:hypothetical protein
MNWLSLYQVPKHFAEPQFPGLYDAGETHIATRIAENDLCGAGPSPSQVEAAVLERLLREILWRCPNLTSAQVAYATRFFAEIVMHYDRAHLAGPPLRVSWFRLSYHVWAAAAARAEVSLNEDAAPKDHEGNILEAAEELGIACGREDLGRLLDHFRAKRDEEDGGRHDHRFRVGLAAATIVQYFRFLHLAAVRNRAFVRIRYLKARLFLHAGEGDAETADEARRYLASHGVHAVAGPLAPAQADALLTILSEQAAAADAFWQGVQAARTAGLRPIVLLTCPRTRLGEMEGAVPEGRRDLYQWLIRTTVVQYQRGDRDGFVSILRGLEPDLPWWWRDDAIHFAMAMDGFSIFALSGEMQGETGVTDRRYPDLLDEAGVAEGVALADAAAPPGPGAPARADEVYTRTVTQRLDERIRFPEGHFRLPWIVLLRQARPRLAQAGERWWDREDEDQLSAAFHAFGLHAKTGVARAFVGALLALPWSASADAAAGVDERTRGLIAATLALSDMAFASNNKIPLRLPLHPAFVSYTSTDADFARELVDHVARHENVDLWWDGHSIAIGRELTETLRRGIEASERFVLIASPEAALSQYVQLEAQAAVQLGRPVIVMVPGAALDPAWRTAVGAWRAAGASVTELSPGGSLDERAVALVVALTRSPEAMADWLRERMALLPQGVGCGVARSNPVAGRGSP